MNKILIPAVLAVLALIPPAAAADSLAVTMVRSGHFMMSDVMYKPYAVWWVEDDGGNMVKILFITHYNNSGPGTTVKCGKSGYLSSLSYYWGRFSDIDGCPGKAGEQCVTCPSCPYDYSMPVDGITGCSEDNSINDSMSITRTWDLTDRDGNTVSAGTYHIFYSAVFLDEETVNGDKTFKVTVTLGAEAFDSTWVSPQEVSGFTADPGFVVKTMAVSYTGSDFGGGGTTPTVEAPYVPNLAPPEPTAEKPAVPGFCGSGSLLASGLVLMGLSGIRRRRKK